MSGSQFDEEDIVISEDKIRHFRENVVEYVQVSKEIRDSSKPIEDKKLRRKQCKVAMLDFAKLHRLDTHMGSYNVKQKKTLKRKHGFEKFLEKHGIEGDFEEFMQMVEETCELKETTHLKLRKLEKKK